MTKKPHICVCICTYKRPEMLRRLLSKLDKQETEELFDYSIVIVDNDRSESARPTVDGFISKQNISISYYVEPNQNIALARNRAVENAKGDFVGFIDDDEFPVEYWLVNLLKALTQYKADGVLGPVKPLFEVVPPKWAIKAGFFERPGYCVTGSVVDWRQTGAGNVLIKRSILSELVGPFDREFGSGGEDQDFFRRAMGLHKLFIWCEEAIAFETVPVERTKLSFQLRRALLRGKASLESPSGRTTGIIKSLAAFALYTILLPVFLIKGRHVLVKYLIKDFDHIGRLLAVCGINVIREKYVSK